MITELNLPNVLVNGSVIISSLSFAGWMFKRWMDTREKQEIKLREDLVSSTAQIAEDLSTKHYESVVELKEKIAGNRQFYSDSYDDIKNSIDKLAGHVAVANGRTAKLEGAVREVVARCEERSRVFYKEGRPERRGIVEEQ